MSASKLSLNLLIDRKAKRVLFAEAGKETIDFLCSILTLPVGTVITLLSKQGMVGCVANIHQSIETLNEEYLQPDLNKDLFLKPKVHSLTEETSLFLPSKEPSEIKLEKKLYRCNRSNDMYFGYDSDGIECNDGRDHFITDDPTIVCPECRSLMDSEVLFVEGTLRKEKESVVNGNGEGFVKGVVTYMVMDDLGVKPMSTISSVTLLKMFNVKDVAALSEMVVHLDMDKGLKLLKTSFQSKNVLTPSRSQYCGLI